MKIGYKIIFAGLLFMQVISAFSQDAQLNLQTRWTGQGPVHEMPTSAAKWMQSPVAMSLQIAVTNFYAATNADLEIDVGSERKIFYGAGVDELGQYIPTNYAPVGVDASLLRQYAVNIVCPNSGPDGSPLFKLGDISDPYDFSVTLSTFTTPSALSQFLWTNFTSAETNAILTDDPLSDPDYLITQTNLVIALNQIITSGSIYNSTLFAGVTLQSDTTNLLAQNPVGQQLVYLNRLLLRDAYAGDSYDLPIPDESDNSGSAQITFFVIPPPQITISQVTSMPNYQVVVNGTQSTQEGDSSQVMLINPGTGYISTNFVTLEITKNKFGHYALGDGCDDPTPGPGIGKWLAMGPGCTQDTNRISLDWSVGLGRTFDGLAFGRLCFKETALSAETYTPSALYYEASDTNILNEANIVFSNVLTTVTNTSGDIYTTTNLILRQIMTYQAFVDILAPDTNNTIMNFYFPNQVATNQDAYGVYTTITGSPFVTWTIQNPDPGTTNNLLIMEQRAGGGSTNSLSRAASTGGVTWTLTQGSGAATRVETRQVSFLGTPPTNRVELDAVSYASSSSPAYQCQETYHFFAWGSELIETRVFNSPDYVTTYDYYDQLENITNAYDTYYSNLYAYGESTNYVDGLPAAYAWYEDPVMDAFWGYGQIKDIIYPDGYWEKRIYNDISAYWYIFVDEEDGAFELSQAGGDYYNQGQLRFVFNPNPSVAGGITNMNDASVYTAHLTQYGYPGSELGQFSEQMNANVPTHGDDQNMQLTGGGGSGPEGPANVFIKMQGVGIVLNDDNAGEGLLDWEYGDGSPNGLNGHSWLNWNPIGAASFFYYDHGIFNSSANTFDLNCTNHLYVFGVTNYPDHRATQISSTGFPYTESWMSSSWMPDTLEDHPINNEANDWLYSSLNFYLLPNLTTKTTQIFHGGNLIQGEKYVCSGGSGDDPHWALLSKIRYYADSLGRATNVARIDGITGQQRTLYSADYRGGSSQDGELLLSETDATGMTVSYSYDALKRVATIITNGYGAQPSITVNVAYDANGRVLSRSVSAGTLSQSEVWGYDLAGRLISHVNTNGIATSTSYSADNLTITSASPGSITIVTNLNLDRTVASVQGNGTISHFYEYGVAYYPDLDVFDGLRLTTNESGHLHSQRWQDAGMDGLDKTAWTEKPVGLATTNTISTWNNYWPNGLLSEQIRPTGLPSTRCFFDLFGNCNWQQSSGTPFDDEVVGLMTAWIFDQGYESTYYGNFRSTSSDTAYVLSGGVWYQATSNYISLGTDSDLARTMKSIHLQQLNGFQSNQMANAIDFDADTNETLTAITVSRSQNIVSNTITEPSVSSLSATSVMQNGLLIQASTLSVSAPILYSYDALGRTNQITDSLGNSSYVTYDPGTGWATSQTDPAGNTTTYSYFGTNEANSGMVKCQTGPTGKNTYYAYTTVGQLFQTWGDVPYPAQYAYSEYGDLTNLITFRGGSNWTGSTWPSSPGTGDNTYWLYDDASGALLSKIDAQEHSTTNIYDQVTGRLLIQSYSRLIGGIPVSITNIYDNYGDIVERDYNDGTPSVLFNNYNRAGQPSEIVDATGTNELAYDFATRLIAVSGANGLYGGITVSNHFIPGYGRNVLKTTGLSSTLETDFSYDAYGRMGSISSGLDSVAYGYLPNSDLLQTTTSSYNGNPVLTTSRQWNDGFRLGSIANVVSGATFTSHNYAYDNLNRRTSASLEDGSIWNYAYNNRNELTGAGRNWSDGSSVTGQQYGYGFDNIGNRTNAQAGSVGNMSTGSCIANSLNEYTNIVTPGSKDILGLAIATNTVTVNSGTADRKGEYFHKTITVPNTNQPVWQEVTNSSGGATVTGGLVFPANSQSLVYDADGNLTFDGIWTYQWDAENRLIEMTMTNISGIAPSNQLQLNFAYDYMNRRISKIVSTNSASSFVPQSTNYFIYDGWNLIAIFTPTSTVQQTFVWGLDVSENMTNAGGIGGLLAIANGGTNYFTSYDGNGNITGLISGADKSTGARYEYSPLGEPLRSTGPIAKVNPFGFSTKFYDAENGLVYYGHRYYNPTQGRWMGRDPAGEDQGGANLYGFVGNDALNNADQVGLSMFDISLGGGFDFGGSDVNQMETDLNFMAGWGAGLKAQSIIIKGHASSGVITMDNDTFLTTGNARNGGEAILDQSGKDLTSLFQSVMAPGGFIGLAGCQTGRGANSLAKNFSLALPGIFVGGGKGLFQLGIPWTTTAIGRKNYYYNGNTVDTAWGPW